MGVQALVIAAAFTPLLAMATCYLRPAHLSHCRGVVDTYVWPKTPKQRVDEFTSHDLDTQYAIYICGDQYIHPGLIELSVPFASQGDVAARYLYEKLSTTEHDQTIVSIVRVYAYMVIDGTYDVRGDASLMSLIEQKAEIPLQSGSKGSMKYLLDVIHGRESKSTPDP